MAVRRTIVTLGFFLVACIALTATANRAFSNAPAPPPELPPRPAAPTASKPVDLVVKKVRAAKMSKVIIPRKFLEGTAAPTVGANEGSGYGLPIQSIVAGIALSLAIISAVLVIRRIGRRRTMVASGTVAAVATVVGLWAASSAIADIAFPKNPGEKEKPQIVIEVVEEGDSVFLILARDAQ